MTIKYTKILTKKVLKRMYIDEKKSALTIAEELNNKFKLNIDYHTIYYWSIRYNIPRRKSSFQTKRLERSRKSPKLKINLTHSWILSYIIGVLVGDGYITIDKWRIPPGKKRYVIGMDVKRLTFCKEFSKALREIGMNPRIMKIKNTSKWRVRACSKQFFMWFKNLSLNEKIDIAMEFPIAFLKGFHESEGNISRKSKAQPHYYQLRIVNTKKEIIMRIGQLLEDLGFHPNYYVHKRQHHSGWNDLYNVMLQRQGEIKRFVKMVNPVVKRIPEGITNA